MTLYPEGKHYKVSHSAPDYLLLDKPACFQPGKANLLVSIDEHLHEMPFLIAKPVNGLRVEAERIPMPIAQIA